MNLPTGTELGKRKEQNRINKATRISKMTEVENSKRKEQNAKNEASRISKMTEGEISRIKEKYAANKAKSRSNRSSDERIKQFKRSVKYGPIFICCCCDQLMFENGVARIDDSTMIQLDNKFSKEELKNIFRNTLESDEYLIKIDERQNPERYLCLTCKRILLKGKLPSMSVANGLSVVNVKENLDLTQLENNLIAKKILFQKVFKLPKSRMAAVKDKIVNKLGLSCAKLRTCLPARFGLF